MYLVGFDGIENLLVEVRELTIRNFGKVVVALGDGHSDCGVVN